MASYDRMNADWASCGASSPSVSQVFHSQGLRNAPKTDVDAFRQALDAGIPPFQNNSDRGSRGASSLPMSQGSYDRGVEMRSGTSDDAAFRQSLDRGTPPSQNNGSTCGEIAAHSPAGGREQEGIIGQTKDDRPSDSMLRNDQDSASSHDPESKAERGDAQTGRLCDISSLFSMASGMMPCDGGVQETTSCISASESDTEAFEGIDDIVSRILVSDPSSGDKEVRLTLSHQTLPDTEIIINRALDGTLNVTLSSKDEAAFQTLVSAQELLRERLERQKTGPVRIITTHGEREEEDSPERRSRGLDFLDQSQRAFR